MESISLMSSEMSSSTTSTPDDASGNLLYFLAFAGAGVSGILHALAMGARKLYGEGHTEYWRRPGWWLGVVCDGCAGALFTFSTPQVAVQILLPIVATTQMCSGFLCGTMCFKERSQWSSRIGLVFAGTGVLLLASHGNAEAQTLSPQEFWSHWLGVPFLIVISIWLIIISCIFKSDRAGGFALLSAFCDGIQFLGTRTAAAALEKKGSLEDPSDVCAVILKIICVLLVLHFQQMALGSEFSRVGAILPVMQNLMCGTLGVCFFGDSVGMTPRFVGASLVIVLGLVLLSRNSREKVQDKVECDTELRGS